MGGMKLNDIPTPKLQCILRATEQDAGSDSMEARILRRELTKRQRRSRQKRRNRRGGGSGV
jgi:hypothetical protein